MFLIEVFLLGLVLIFLLFVIIYFLNYFNVFGFKLKINKLFNSNFNSKINKTFSILLCFWSFFIFLIHFIFIFLILVFLLKFFIYYFWLICFLILIFLIIKVFWLPVLCLINVFIFYFYFLIKKVFSNCLLGFITGFNYFLLFILFSISGLLFVVIVFVLCLVVFILFLLNLFKIIKINFILILNKIKNCSLLDFLDHLAGFGLILCGVVSIFSYVLTFFGFLWVSYMGFCFLFNYFGGFGEPEGLVSFCFFCCSFL